MEAAGLLALWASVEGSVGRLAVVPPAAPSAAVAREVDAGGIGRAVAPAGGVAAWGVLPVNQPLLWLTLTDDRLSENVNALTERALEGSWASPKLLYQRIDLPWPFADRHWVLRLANNTRLAQAAGVWERSWTVDSAALARGRTDADAAVFDASTELTVNRGAWLLVPVDEGHTLAVYQAWTDLGGNIPAEAADTWARSSLSGLYAGLRKHAAVVRSRYGAGCRPQPGADGAPIACLD